MAERFFSFPISQLFSPLYCRSGEDCNVWMYVLKSALFGEYSFDRNRGAADALVALNLLMILASLAAMAYVMLRCRETDNFARFGLFGIWLAQMACFLAFNLEYPFGCTMDFRYILPTAIIGAIYIGIALNHLNGKRKAVSGILCYAGIALIALFGLASVLFYAV
jgi:hypothetical protein